MRGIGFPWRIHRSRPVAHWINGEIVEEKLFYDKISMKQQIGLM